MFKRKSALVQDRAHENFALRSATLTNGQTIHFDPNDIVLVVGKNGSGKSTFLREVRSSVENSRSPKKIFANSKFQGSDPAELERRINSTFKVVQEASLRYVKRSDGTVDFYVESDLGKPDALRLGGVTKAFVTLLDAEGRLRLTNNVGTIDVFVSKPSHPFHVFMVDQDKLSSASNLLKEAFDLELTINRIGNPIRGYVAKSVPSDGSLASERDLPKVAELLTSQGDGLRSFAGIVAEIEAMDHPMVLIDEPEAFLHPPQAKRLGRVIADRLADDRQAFIATHDSNFLQGMIANFNPRLRVLRIERGDKLSLTDISNQDLKAAESLPAIANSNLLNSLFYDRTVVCEADADCKLFDRIVGQDADRFWFSAGGKQQFPKVASMLSKFGVDWRAILDLDALHDWSMLLKLAELKGLDISSRKKRLDAALRQLRPVDYSAAKSRLQAAAENEDPELAVRGVKRELEKLKSTSTLKEVGLSGIPKGQDREFVERFLGELAQVGILLLKRGELECYVPKVGGHGPSWVNSVLLDREKHSAELSLLAEEIGAAI